MPDWWTTANERMYKHVKDSEKARHPKWSEKKTKQVAAATVNKMRGSKKSK